MKYSSLGWFMSNQETSFVTIGQRVLATPLKVYFQYRHPDVFDRIFHIIRGDISKASRGINLSENIFARFNSTLRQENITHDEYIQVGKDRDVGLNQISLFEAKVACSNGEQILNRDIYHLGVRFDFFRMLSYYFKTVGFYVSPMMVALMRGNNPLKATMASQSAVQLGLLIAFLMVMEFGLQWGFRTALGDIIIMQLQLYLVLFTFSFRTKSHYFGRIIRHDGAKYRATGRGFVGRHVKFAENYKMYSKSHFTKRVAMELEDSLYPLLREVSIGVNPYDVFEDAEWALLVGAKPRGPGMERAALLDINGQIFAEQGKALNAVASRSVKVIIVGNPCNTNALICLKNAPNIPAKNFHALTRLDENRAKCQLALKAGVFYDKVSNVTIWGNHSTTQVPDFVNAKINGVPVKKVITDTKWLEQEFTERVQKRGGVLIQKWGRSSAASTAVSIVDGIRSLITPTPEGDWFSSGVYTNGNPYGIAEDIVFSMPCRSKGDGDYELVKEVVIDDFLRERIRKASTEAELIAEKRCVAHLTGEGNAFCDLPEDTMLPGEQ
ncbi:hypothetical protein IEQ34_014022 [Dendrobium chrysotoxum]|uniref:malate dehydrogenase (NADP(+)) n=1 Tax=Dendrobium chrysotoxum TaxID=161865 RepID=A0AAV7GIT6_DENCH|nr:hypothetical protein IEQ34_014022 [Dendrobium chrysotoxum]